MSTTNSVHSDLPLFQTGVLNRQVGGDDDSESSNIFADTTTNRYQARHGSGLLIKFLFPELSTTKTHEGNTFSSLPTNVLNGGNESAVVESSSQKSENSKNMVSSALSLWKSSIILADNSVKNYFNLSACVQFITDKIENTGIYETRIVGPIVEGLSKLGEGFAQLTQEALRTTLVALAIIVPGATAFVVGVAVGTIAGTGYGLYLLGNFLSGAAVSAKDSAVVAAYQKDYKEKNKEFLFEKLSKQVSLLSNDDTRAQAAGVGLLIDIKAQEFLADAHPTVAKANENPITPVGFELELTDGERSAILEKIEFNSELNKEFYKAYNAERQAFAEAVNFAMHHGKSREEAGKIAIDLMDGEGKPKLSEMQHSSSAVKRDSYIPQCVVPESMRTHPKTALEQAVLGEINIPKESQAPIAASKADNTI
ncbi:MAG: hypothetical protein FJZ56_02945 [Chlamydiae bacterium]|nr:hypothetical protein [Chlamydiota bacterium]